MKENDTKNNNFISWLKEAVSIARRQKMNGTITLTLRIVSGGVASVDGQVRKKLK